MHHVKQVKHVGLGQLTHSPYKSSLFADIGSKMKSNKSLLSHLLCINFRFCRASCLFPA